MLVDSNEPTDEQDRASVDDGSDNLRLERTLTALTYSGVFRFLVQVLGLELGGDEGLGTRRRPAFACGHA